MNMIMKSFLAAAALTVAASSAQAATNILQYSQLGDAETMTYTDNGAAGYTISTNGAKTVLTTVNDPVSAAFGFGLASFSFTATGNGIAVNTGGSSWSQALTGGSLSFTALAPITVGAQIIPLGANILTLSFLGGAIEADVPGTAGSARVTLPGSSFFNVSSDYFEFPPLFMTDFSIALSGVTPGFLFDAQNPGSLANGRFTNFAADSTGTFTAGAIPEPASWAMMIAGFGLVGLSRRRSRVTAVAA